ncbi:uncharacterized protein LOC135484802 [Lineus longissimus]|uniref:uncharacterized protein LOC135484802 n=1 Tax=Lineus longissimus TaxID=88925 RepID=UPI00315CF2E3
MSRATFDKLCELLRPQLEKQDTVMRNCMPVDQKVAAVLRTLAGTGELEIVADLFGISRASLSIFVKDVVQAIVSLLTPQLIQLPSSEEAYDIMDRFKEKWGFPNSIGAIDGTHIPIMAPPQYHTDFYNRKCYYSYNCQAFVDDRYCFRDLCVGMPGSLHDARVLAYSDLFKEFEVHGYLNDVSVNVNGATLPPVILGDPAYPLLHWIMKPYPETTGTTEKQKNFNYQLSKNRMVVENSFGRLKGRWRRLLKRIDFNNEDVPDLFIACCTLHNLCELEGDAFDDKWLDKIQDRLVDIVPMRAVTTEFVTRNNNPNAIRTH